MFTALTRATRMETALHAAALSGVEDRAQDRLLDSIQQPSDAEQSNFDQANVGEAFDGLE